MESKTLTVTGMSCSHCEKAVVDALIEAGVATAKASAKDKNVCIEYDPGAVSMDAIKSAIAEAGFEA